MLEPTLAISPTFVANGDSDPMILPRYSFLLAGLLPHANLKIYPDAAHGFLFQHHAIGWLRYGPWRCARHGARPVR